LSRYHLQHPHATTRAGGGACADREYVRKVSAGERQLRDFLSRKALLLRAHRIDQGRGGLHVDLGHRAHFENERAADVLRRLELVGFAFISFETTSAAVANGVFLRSSETI